MKKIKDFSIDIFNLYIPISVLVGNCCLFDEILGKNIGFGVGFVFSIFMGYLYLMHIKEPRDEKIRNLEILNKVLMSENKNIKNNPQ